MISRKKMGIAGLCAVLILALSAAPSFAQGSAEETHDQGSVRLALSGSFSVDTLAIEGAQADMTFYQIQLLLSAGYFAIDALEVGIGAGLTRSWDDEDGSEASMMLTAEAFIKYYLINESQVVPYLGVLGGLGFYEFGYGTDATSYVVGGMVGVEILVGEATSVFVEYRGTYTSYDFDFGFGDIGVEQWTNAGLVGVATYF